MTSDRIARDYLRQARARRIALDALLGSGVHAAVVRESQEVVELVLKGALRFVGAEPPKRHDVHGTVERFIERFPDEWRHALAELRETLDRLADDRGPAFYGDEAHDVGGFGVMLGKTSERLVVRGPRPRRELVEGGLQLFLPV
jgi:HEPN domain-containing protein